jgi:hypothetical protein
LALYSKKLPKKPPVKDLSSMIKLTTFGIAKPPRIEDIVFAEDDFLDTIDFSVL